MLTLVTIDRVVITAIDNSDTDRQENDSVKELRINKNDDFCLIGFAAKNI